MTKLKEIHSNNARTQKGAWGEGRGEGGGVKT